MILTIVTGIAVIAAAAYLTARGWDVRLVLLAAAVLLGLVGGNLPSVVRAFLDTFSSEKFVLPICSAMGFAYVLKHTGCDDHLVRALLVPVRRVRFLLLPGVVLAGFVVNVPVISQTSTAVCLGAVVVPLLRAAGFSSTTIGTALLLGASVGGELLNAGAPELLAVSKLTHVPTADLIRTYIPPLLVPMVGVSTAVFWLQSWWLGRQTIPPITAQPPEPTPTAEPTAPASRINFLKAAVPLVPLLLLFLCGPPLKLLPVPPEWLAVESEEAPHPEKVIGGRLIGLAMLVGVAVAAAIAPRAAGGCMRAFFDGAGYAFTHVVSLIIVATAFAEGVKGVGLAKVLGDLIQAVPQLLHPLAGVVPAAFAAVSGSGMASTQSLYGFFHAPAEALGDDPNRVGALVSVGSAAGRTMSPVAAVTFMAASLTGTTPWQLVKRVALPLGCGLAVVILLRLCGVV